MEAPQIASSIYKLLTRIEWVKNEHLALEAQHNVEAILNHVVEEKRQMQVIIDSVPLFAYSIKGDKVTFWQGEGLSDLGLNMNMVNDCLLENMIGLFPTLAETIEEASESGKAKNMIELGGRTFDNYVVVVNKTDIMGVCLDISAIEKAKKESEQFAYSTSHDLQQPLRAVANYNAIVCRLIERVVGLIKSNRTNEAEELLTSEIKEYLIKQKATTSRMNAIIDALLQLSRTETLEVESNSLSEILDEVIDDLSHQIEQIELSGQKVEINKVSFLPTVICNRPHIRQVLQNLVSNALKYRDPSRNCVISIGAHPIASSQTQSDASSCLFRDRPYWKLWVIDNGIGIPAGWEKRIFMPFKSAHTGINNDGVGIGLSIVQKIIEQHKGTIWVEQPKNNEPGSEFYFTLPQ